MKLRIHYDVFTGIFLLLVSLGFYFMSADFPEEGKLFPVTIISLLIFFSVLIIASGIKKSITNKQTDNQVDVDEDEAEGFTGDQIKMPLIILILSLVYIALIGVLGFFVSTVLFMTAVLLMLKVKSIKGYIFTVVGTNLFLYVLFVQLLHVALPTGILF